MIKKINDKKNKAMAIAKGNVNKLLIHLEALEAQRKKSLNIPEDKTIIKNPETYANQVFSNQYFQEYVKYASVAKRCEKKITSFYGYTFVLSTLLAVGSYLLFKNIAIAIIIFIFISALLLILIKIFDKAEPYNKFYEETMTQIMFNYAPDYTFELRDSSAKINREWLNSIIKTSFDSFNVSNVKHFSNETLKGEISDIVLHDKRSHKNADGEITEYDKKVFDGFSFDLNYRYDFKYLNGAVIRIFDDDNLLSSLAEDTRQSIYQSDREFMFNSEELNKAMDCYIKGYNSFGDIDLLMQRIHQIITPSFEEKLIFLRNRFNSFNMMISDSGINFTVNLKKSLFQKVKSDEFLEFNDKYKNKVKRVVFCNPTITSASDFMYYNFFPVIEQIFFIILFDNIMQQILNRSKYLNLNSNVFSANDNTIKEVIEQEKILMDSEYKDFMNKYEDIIKECYKSSKHL